MKFLILLVFLSTASLQASPDSALKSYKKDLLDSKSMCKSGCIYRATYIYKAFPNWEEFMPTLEKLKSKCIEKCKRLKK